MSESEDAKVIYNYVKKNVQVPQDESGDSDQHVSLSNKTGTGGVGPTESTGGNVEASETQVEAVEGYFELSTESGEESEGLLDAEFALGDNTDKALGILTNKTENSAQLLEVVIGRDDRVRISTPVITTSGSPWRMTCHLLITAADGSKWTGTGWFIGPKTVVTAGHCVFIKNRGGWVKQIEVIPARDGESRPYKSVVSTYFTSVNGWVQNNNRSHDYGAIILPSALGATTGYFGIKNTTPMNVQGMHANITGYPGDKPAGTQWFHSRPVKEVTPTTLVYDIDTAGGQSGSCVWIKTKDSPTRYAIGIHTNGSQLGNSATRIITAVYDNLAKWKNL